MPENPGTAVKGFLSKEVAGFPVWVWGLIVIAGIGAAYLIPKYFGGGTQDTGATPLGTSNIPNTSTDTGGTGGTDTGGTGGGGGTPPAPSPTPPPVSPPPGHVTCKRSYTVPNWPANSPEYGWAHVARRANTTVTMLILCNPDVPGLASGGHGHATAGQTVCAVCI